MNTCAFTRPAVCVYCQSSRMGPSHDIQRVANNAYAQTQVLAGTRPHQIVNPLNLTIVIPTWGPARARNKYQPKPNPGITTTKQPLLQATGGWAGTVSAWNGSSAACAAAVPWPFCHSYRWPRHSERWPRPCNTGTIGTSTAPWLQLQGVAVYVASRMAHGRHVEKPTLDGFV